MSHRLGEFSRDPPQRRRPRREAFRKRAKPTMRDSGRRQDQRRFSCQNDEDDSLRPFERLRSVFPVKFLGRHLVVPRALRLLRGSGEVAQRMGGGHDWSPSILALAANRNFPSISPLKFLAFDANAGSRVLKPSRLVVPLDFLVGKAVVISALDSVDRVQKVTRREILTETGELGEGVPAAPGVS